MMKKQTLKASLLLLPFVVSCSLDMKTIEHKAAMMNHYEHVALKLARENRELHAHVKRLEFDIEKLKQVAPTKVAIAEKEEAHSEHNTEHVTHGRSIASVSHESMAPSEKKDFVEFKTYKWHADDLMKIADKEFLEKHYEKAAQFYTSLVKNYPTDKGINDGFYFKAGIAAFESGTHHDWTIDHFEALMTKYPTSQYFRSAKLWVALTHMKMGDKKRFYTTVEEFRKKYRNTKEWQILSSYYEKIEEKTNE